MSNTSIAAAAQSIRNGAPFRRGALVGEPIAVLSPAPDLRRHNINDGDLNELVIEGARLRHEAYKSRGTRVPEPLACVYYLRIGHEAVGAVMGDGTVYTRFSIAPMQDRSKEALRAAMKDLANRQQADGHDWL